MLGVGTHEYSASYYTTHAHTYQAINSAFYVFPSVRCEIILVASSLQDSSLGLIRAL